MGTLNRRVKFTLKIPNRFGKIATSRQWGIFFTYVVGPIFMKFSTDVQHLWQISLLSFEGQGQSSRSKLPY